MNPVASTPDSIHDFTRRMVLCNLKKSLEPLGDESLARDQSIQKFAVIILRDWLPRFNDQGNGKSVSQLCTQIKKYFALDPAQDKVNALAAQIQVTCGSACTIRDAWIEPLAKEHGLDQPFSGRLAGVLKRHSSKEERIVCCQWMMSILFHECERMHALRKVFVLQHEIEQNRNSSFHENTQFTLSGAEMVLSIDFPADQVRDFDEVCFWLNFNQIKNSLVGIDQALSNAMRSKDNFRTRTCMERFQADLKKIEAAVSALSQYNPILKRAGEDLLFFLQGKITLAAIGCLNQRDEFKHIRFAPSPSFIDPMSLFGETATILILLMNKTLTSLQATSLYFAYFEHAQALYSLCRQTRDDLLGSKDPSKYNFCRIQNSATSTLPKTLEIEPWVALPGRAAVIQDEILAPYLRSEPSAPSAEAPAEPRKKADKPRQRERPLPKFSTTEEKCRLDEERVDAEAPIEEPKPSVWAPLPPRPALPERSSASLVELHYAPRVERWFCEQLQPEDFSEYDGHPSLKDLCYHAFPIEIDGYAGSALEQVWINTTTGFSDRQLLIPAEFALPDSDPVRGVISYAIGQDGVCYHRCFHSMKTQDLVEKFGFHRFEKADFPALISENVVQGKSRGIKPNRGRKVHENPALGTVTFLDERTKAEIRIFTG